MQRTHKSHTEKADLIMIFTDEKKDKNILEFMNTKRAEYREKSCSPQVNPSRRTSK